MIHLYHGDGKGKTTAACGLAIRAAGSGMRVLFMQFFKDGSSSEIKVLAEVPGITVMMPELCNGRFKNMTGAQKLETEKCYGAFLHKVISEAGGYGLIVMDEAVSAYGYGMIDRVELLSFLREEGGKREIVLTGRDPDPELKELADYETEMRKIKHPFDKGIIARKGIEF